MGDGTRVGSVTDVLFNGLDVNSLVVHGDHGNGLLPYRDVLSNGPDAITIESSTLIDWNAGPESDVEGKGAQHLRKLAVMDADGAMLGHVHDMDMDEPGHVENITVRGDGIFGFGGHETRIQTSRVRAVGPKMITVQMSTD